jgi:hypothetical protein
MSVHIEQFDDKSKRRLISAVGDLGKASGLEAGVKILEALADNKRRVVGTGELKMAAVSLREMIEEIRIKARAELAALERESA